jgi:uncharacterized protein YndB with AHSA1/START domain
MPVGLTKDAGWEIGVSRTLPCSLDEAWALLTSDEGRAVWLDPADGTVGEIRSCRALDRIRLTWTPSGWDHDSTVQVAIRPMKTGTSIRFHQERMASGRERQQQRAHWAAVIDRLEALLSR